MMLPSEAEGADWSFDRPGVFEALHQRRTYRSMS